MKGKKTLKKQVEEMKKAREELKAKLDLLDGLIRLAEKVEKLK